MIPETDRLWLTAVYRRLADPDLAKDDFDRLLLTARTMQSKEERALPLDGFHASDRTAQFFHARRVFQLTGDLLELQVELLLFDLDELLVELFHRHFF